MWPGPASVQSKGPGWPCAVCCAVTPSRKVASTPSLLPRRTGPFTMREEVADTRKRRSR